MFVCLFLFKKKQTWVSRKEKYKLASPLRKIRRNYAFMYIGHTSTLSLNCLSVLLYCISIPSYSWNEGLSLNSQFVSITFSCVFFDPGLPPWSPRSDAQTKYKTRGVSHSLSWAHASGWCWLSELGTVDSGSFVPFWLRHRSGEILWMALMHALAGSARTSLALPLWAIACCLCNAARFTGCVKKLLVQGISQVFKQL